MFSRVTEVLQRPSLIQLRGNLLIARFEMMKVCSALEALRLLLRDGVLTPGDTVIDSSSGLYAQSLALAAHRFGLNCYIVGSTTISPDLQVQLRLLGATLECVERSSSLKYDQLMRVSRIHEILREHPDFHWMRQYHDRVHYAGYAAIADAVADEIGLDNLSIIGGVGSGASTGGIVSVLRGYNDSVRAVGIQPFGSLTFGSEAVADPDILVAGIGSSIPFDNVCYPLYDEIHWLGFNVALSGTIALLADHTIYAGPSTGLGYAVASHLAGSHPDQDFLFIAPDTGHRYAESVYSRFAEAEPLADFTPSFVDSAAELRMPWSAMHWNRRTYSIQEEAGS